MTEIYYYGDLNKKEQRNVDRDRSRENVAADYDAADYMKSHGYGKSGRKKAARKR